jgi:hypothetical protein
MTNQARSNDKWVQRCARGTGTDEVSRSIFARMVIFEGPTERSIAVRTVRILFVCMYPDTSAKSEETPKKAFLNGFVHYSHQLFTIHYSLEKYTMHFYPGYRAFVLQSAAVAR